MLSRWGGGVWEGRVIIWRVQKYFNFFVSLVDVCVFVCTAGC